MTKPAANERRPPALCSADYLASRLGIPARWLRQEAAAGRLPHLRAGSRVLFAREAVERALLERAREKPEEAQP